LVPAKQAVDIRSERAPCSLYGCAEATDGAGVWGSEGARLSRPANPDERPLKMVRDFEILVNEMQQTAIIVLHGNVILVKKYNHPVGA
jgi:hypothetical protein